MAYVALDVALGLGARGLAVLLRPEGDEAVPGALPAVLPGEIHVQHVSPAREVLPHVLLRHLRRGGVQLRKPESRNCRWGRSTVQSWCFRV